MPANDAGLARLPTVIGLDAVCTVDAIEAPRWVIVNRGTHESIPVSYQCMYAICGLSSITSPMAPFVPPTLLSCVPHRCPYRPQRYLWVIIQSALPQIATCHLRFADFILIIMSPFTPLVLCSTLRLLFARPFGGLFPLPLVHSSLTCPLYPLTACSLTTSLS